MKDGLAVSIRCTYCGLHFGTTGAVIITIDVYCVVDSQGLLVWNDRGGDGHCDWIVCNLIGLESIGIRIYWYLILFKNKDLNVR